MKVTQECHLDIFDATKDPFKYFGGCRGEKVIMSKKEFIAFVSHPLVVDKLHYIKAHIAGLDLEVTDD